MDIKAPCFHLLAPTANKQPRPTRSLFVPSLRHFAPSRRPEPSSEAFQLQLHPPLIDPPCPLPSWSSGPPPRGGMPTKDGSRPSTPSHLLRESPTAPGFPRPARGPTDDGAASCFRYGDSDHMGFGHLRILNEDRVESGTGFGTHPHREFEIFSYIVDGGLEQCVFRPSPLTHRCAYAEHLRCAFAARIRWETLR